MVSAGGSSKESKRHDFVIRFGCTNLVDIPHNEERYAIVTRGPLDQAAAL